jgi:hypothetical protein
MVAIVALAANDPQPERSGSYEFSGFPLEGTVWHGRFIPEENAWVRFEPNGVLWWKHKSGSFRNGSWKQTGNRVWFQTMGHYAEFNGEIQGNRLVGSAHNVANNNWKWELDRRAPSEAPVDPPPLIPRREKEN